MKLSQLGEFGLIELIKKHQKNTRRDTVVGIGDDCAVLRMTNDKCQMSNYLLVTADTLIEGVHFDLKHMSFFDLGYKAMLVNIADIAAMGGIPTHAVVTIGIRKNVSVESILRFQKGLNKLAKKYKIDIVGGDTVSSPKAIMVTIYLLGMVERKNILLRSKAKIGDAILVTGRFGLAAASGFRTNRHPLRLPEARKIACSRLANSMIDSSDGLARSVSEICKASKVGARLFEKQIPVAKGATLKNALYGGEDYELVFTAPQRNVKKLQKIVKCKVVGEIVAKEKGTNFENGFEHFK